MIVRSVLIHISSCSIIIMYAAYTLLSLPKSTAKRSIAIIATIVNAVLSLPHIPAATTTPSPAAQSLSPYTINSLAMFIITGTAEHNPSCEKQTRADKTSTLSARGSKNLPKFVTRFWLLAICPSKKSVIDAMMNTTSAHIADTGTISHSKKKMKNGTSITLIIVSLLGRFIC